MKQPKQNKWTVRGINRTDSVVITAQANAERQGKTIGQYVAEALAYLNMLNENK